MIAVFAFEVEGVEHEAYMRIARVFGVCGHEFLRDLAAAFEEFFRQGVYVDLDCNIFARVLSRRATCELVTSRTAATRLTCADLWLARQSQSFHNPIWQ